MGYPALRAGRGGGGGPPSRRGSARAAGPPAVRVPRAQPLPRLPARRADRRAVAGGPARGGGLGPQRAAVEAAPRAGRGRAARARRAAAAAPGRGRASTSRTPPPRSSRPSRRWRPATGAGGRRGRAPRSSTDLQTFLPDAEGGWAAEQRRELDTIRLRALETLAEAGLRQGGRELGAAEQAARAAIAAAPFRESAHRLLMEVHEAAGNPAEALRAFEELRSLLREELGTTPGPGAMAVFERVLRGEPPPARPRAGGRAARGRWSSPPPGRRRWPARSTATRSSAAVSSSPISAAAGARRWTGSARSCCWPATRGSARRVSPPSWPRARTRTAPSCSTGASTRRR